MNVSSITTAYEILSCMAKLHEVLTISEDSAEGFVHDVLLSVSVYNGHDTKVNPQSTESIHLTQWHIITGQ